MAILKGFPPSNTISPGPRIRELTWQEELNHTIGNPKLSFVEMMGLVITRPSMYLGTRDIFKFEALYHGWCMGRARQDETDFMRDFIQWTRKKLKVKLPEQNGWALMFKTLAEGDAINEEPLPEDIQVKAFQIMKMCWDEFIAQAPKDSFPYEERTKFASSRYRSIDAV